MNGKRPLCRPALFLLLTCSVLIIGWAPPTLAAGGAGHGVTVDATSGIGTLVALLQDTRQALAAGDAARARTDMQRFITAWPTAEGAVKVKSPEAYTATENNMTRAASLLASVPPRLNEAGRVVGTMLDALKPLATSGYTAWDASIILLREGLEAVLVISALIAFLSRTHNEDKQAWIWYGAAAGIAASILLAIAFRLVLAAAVAGVGSFVVEGVTGLIAAVLLVTVGVWMHGNANANAWQKHIRTQVDSALASGKLWSLAGVACVATLREGVETVLFYLGLAASIPPSQLALGIAAGAGLLLVLGYAVMRMGRRLPLRPFFLAATVLVYYLAFKFTGQSIHALQVVGRLPATAAPTLPSSPSFGVYPTWQTTGAQVLLLALIAGSALLIERRARAIPPGADGQR